MQTVVGRTEQTNVKFHRRTASSVKTSYRAFFAQYVLNVLVFLSFDVSEITVDFVGDENHYSVNATLYELSTVSVKLYVPLCAPTHLCAGQTMQALCTPVQQPTVFDVEEAVLV